MKKMLIILAILGLVIALTGSDAILWCKRMLLNEPTIHTVDAGDYLSKVALKYYGNAKYWRELALINRAPDSDLIFPGEDIFIPNKEVIEQLYRARSLSRVNSLVDGQKQLYAQNQTAEENTLAETNKSLIPKSGTVIKSEKMVKLDPEPQDDSITETERANSSPIVFSIIGGSIFLAAIAFVFYLKKNEAKTNETEDESEPDYQKYKASRGKRVYV